MRLRVQVSWLLAVVAAFAVVLALPTTAYADDDPLAVSARQPWSVPALQQWQPGGADFLLPRGALHLQVDPRYAAQLNADAQTFADDLRALTGRHVVVGRPSGRPAVIRLTLDPAWTERGSEASRITVDGDVTIAGPTPAGVFLGTRTVLQLLRQSSRIPGGVAEDWPGYAERSFMIDNGRKFFTIEWAKRQIRELSYLKYNQFHWHITDNAGFRIESIAHPEVVSPEHWTQQQVKELVAYAAKYHVEILPEIDMPGHMLFALRNHPELQVIDASGNRYPRNLDPTKPEARQFAKELLDELIPLFPGRYVHTGGDEFTSNWDNFPSLKQWAQQKYGPEANAQDAALDFTNFVAGVVGSHGKTMRMWNDGAQGGSKVTASRDIVIEYWTSQQGPVLAREFLDQGFRLINANRDYLYDVPGLTTAWNNIDARKLYDGWDMTRWHGWIGENTTAPRAEGVLGGQLHIWNDQPNAATEEQQTGRVEMPLRAHIQKLWDSPPPAGGWDAFAAMAFAAGHEPQWQRLGGQNQNLALGKMTWSSARERPDCHESALVDGHDRTRWCGPKTAPQSVIVDLGEPVDLGTVTLKWETAFASGYRLDVSDDLTAWRDLYSTARGDGGLDLVPVSGKGRYLRLSMTTRGSVHGYSLWEIEVHARGALPPAAFSASFDPKVVLGPGGRTSLTVSNATGSPVKVRWTAEPPVGVTVRPQRGSLSLPANGSAQVTVEVAAGTPGSARVPFRMESDRVQVTGAELLVSVPYANIVDGYANVGVTADADVAPPTLGVGFDGARSSFSAEALAAAGVTPGRTFTVDGVTVRWPDVPTAEQNNVVANRQSVTLNASGTRLGILAAATYGPASGDWIVHYSDGTSATVRLSTPDWTSAPPAGSHVLATMPYRNNADTGHPQSRSQLFFQSIPLEATKTVTAVTLPVVSESPVQGQPALHVFDIAVG